MRALIYSVFILASFMTNAEPLFYGPVSAAMGGTGRAGISSSEGAFINPATIPLIKTYELIGYYRDGYLDDGVHRQGWAVGAVDNSEGVLFPGALHYARTRDTGRAGEPADGEIWHVSGAYLLSDRLSVGASAYRVQYDVGNQPHYTQWAGSLGAIVLVNEDLSLAYVIDNIGKPGSDTPPALRQDLQQSVGLFYRFAELATARFDVSKTDKFNPDHKLNWMAGLESAFNEFMVFRIGYRRDELADSRIYTAGIGFNGPRLRFDYTVEKNAENTSGALHSVDLRVPF
jgi:hypothetical protein